MRNDHLPSDDQPSASRRLVLKAGVATIGSGLLGTAAAATTTAKAATGLHPDEYLALDASEMAAMVRSGSLSAAELLDAALMRSAEVNPKINAVVMLHVERARRLLASRHNEQGRKGALAGVPMLVKDLFTYLADTTTTNGSYFFKDSEPSRYSSTLLERYESAGALVFGKTACPEFGLTTTTESRLWGKARNPWNLAMSAGGSSGGSAAAVAAGIIPVAHATDGGGSIRIPASYCGVFGLKPSRYRTPSGPGRFEGSFGASVAHVVSRSVRDSALLLDVGQGHAKGSPYWSSPLERPFVAEVGRPPARLRVALVSDSLTGTPLDPAIRKVLDDTVRLLLSLGHQIDAARLPIDPRELFTAHGAAIGCALLTTIHDREKILGRAVREDELEPATHQILRNAARVSGEDLYRARHSFETIGMSMESMFDRYDVILSPVTATLTPLLGKLSLQQPYEDYARAAMGSAAFMVPANVSGQPSMSIPSGWSEQGLPIGMMFTARIGGEGLLFRLAGELERERPWAGRQPELNAPA